MCDGGLGRMRLLAASAGGRMSGTIGQLSFFGVAASIESETKLSVIVKIGGNSCGLWHES